MAVSSHLHSVVRLEHQALSSPGQCMRLQGAGSQALQPQRPQQQQQRQQRALRRLRLGRQRKGRHFDLMAGPRSLANAGVTFCAASPELRAAKCPPKLGLQLACQGFAGLRVKEDDSSLLCSFAAQQLMHQAGLQP